MADKKLNEVSQLTDFDYALVVKGNDVAKVTKQQLATILGGLLDNLGLFPFMKRLNYYDIDDITLASGIYGINNTGGHENAPSNDSSGIKLGIIIIFNGRGLSLGGDPVVQIAVEYMAKKIKVRTYWATMWYDWVTISLT